MPAAGRWARAAWGVTGLSSLVWLSLEDRSLTAVHLLAAMLAVSIGLTVARRLPAAARIRTWVVRGAAAGLLVAPLATLLILVKVGVHAHPDPDFTLSDLRTVIDRLPLWVLVGAVGGAGAALLDRARAGRPG